MDDRRILAEIERRLARDDPELASRMDALNHQFPDDQHDAGRNDGAADDDGGGGRQGLRRKAITALLILALAGMILTAMFTKPPPADDNHGPPNGPNPAVSVHTQRRGPRSRTAPPRRRVGSGSEPMASVRRNA
ncbi:DUF3040 domain-containing protein [Streptomyces albicerus]|uniref:DUF3040 domain-containing protein n=1 Tax=Streptomyces albicerus TaxID=2569859 RepID=UPI001788C313|nr:DUF3040 domain-containing protein [Streptomyces albicerus]